MLKKSSSESRQHGTIRGSGYASFPGRLEFMIVTMQTFPRFLLFVFIYIVSTTMSCLAQDTNLAASDILRQMKQTYAEAQTYVDQGIVSSVFFENGKKRVVEKPFKTAFIRPYQFRYEFQEKKGVLRGEDKFVIFLADNNLQTYWSLDPQQQQIKPKSIGEALSAAAGISGGSARWVPTMLIPDKARFKNPFNLSKPKRVSDDVVDGVDCFQISDPTDYRHLTLWIGQGDFLLRKIYREQDFGDFQLEETTSYKPRVDVAVDRDLLEFIP